MEIKQPQRSFVYAVAGTKIPQIPTGLCRFVTVSLVERPWHTDEEIEFFGDFPVNKWDCWEVTGATVGFNGSGALRFSCAKIGLCLTWIKKTNRIYGVSDYGPIRANFRLCRECGRIAGQSNTSGHVAEEYFDRSRGVAFMVYHCTNCGHLWEIERPSGRPRAKSPKQIVNNKSGYIRQRHKNCKAGRQRTFQPQFV